MTDVGVMEEVLAANAAYAEQAEVQGLPNRPQKQTAILACMDARLDVHAALGLQPGDAHVIRNAGGIVTDDVIRSLLLSQRLLGTRRILLVHHTDCGLQMFSEDELKAEIEADSGVPVPFGLGAFDDVEASVKVSIDRLRSSPLLPHTGDIHGFVFHVDSGRLHSVPR